MKLNNIKTRSPYINTILILTGLGIAINFLILVSNLFSLSLIFNSPLLFSVITEFIFTSLNIIIFSIYLTKLYVFPSKRIKWTDIVFIYLVLQIILVRLFYALETKAKISWENTISNSSSFISHSVSLQVFTGIGLLLVLGIVWYTFRKHLKNQTPGLDYLKSLE